MPFKPSEAFSRALDDAEVRPNEINARVASDASASPADRLGALISLTSREKAKRAAIREYEGLGSPSVADQVISLFRDSRGDAAGSPGVNVPLPGYRHGGLHLENVDIMSTNPSPIGRLPFPPVQEYTIPSEGIASLANDPIDVLARTMDVNNASSVRDSVQIEQDVMDRMAALRRAERTGIFGPYPDEDAREYERRMRMRELGVPIPLVDRFSAYVPDRKVVDIGSKAGEELINSGIPPTMDVIQSVASILPGTGAYLPPENAFEITEDFLRVAPVESDLVGGEGNGNGENGNGENGNGKEPVTFLDPIPVQGDKGGGLSDLEQAVILLNAAAGLSAPIRPGESTAGNLSRSLARGTQAALSAQIQKERNESMSEYRDRIAEQRNRQNRRALYNDALRYADGRLRSEYGSRFDIQRSLNPEEFQGKRDSYIEEFLKQVEPSSLALAPVDDALSAFALESTRPTRNR